MKQFSFGLMLLSCLFLFFSCDKEAKQKEQVKEDLSSVEETNESAFIRSHTAGIVSRDQVIEVHAAMDMLPDRPAGSELTEEIFLFTPKVKGKLVLKDERTLQFYPEKKMAEDKEYKVQIKLSKLFNDVPADKEFFEFSFTTMAQNYEVSYEPIVIKAEQKGLTLKGIIVTADEADSALVEEILILPNMNSEAKTTWIHEGKIHTFVITGIAQKDDEYELEFKCDGKPIGVSRRDSTKITFPGMGSFDLDNYRIGTEKRGNYLTLYFSNPVDSNQNLKGLIQINNKDLVNTSVSGNTIRVYPKKRIIGTVNLTINEGIKNIYGQIFEETLNFPIAFYAENPEVKMIQKSGIYTGDGPLRVPFEAITLEAVDIQIIRIFEDNMPRFFQFNKTIKGNSNLAMVGRPEFQGSVVLDTEEKLDLYKWNRFSIDLSPYIEEEPGALYWVIINFRRSQFTLSWSHKGRRRQRLYGCLRWGQLGRPRC